MDKKKQDIFTKAASSVMHCPVHEEVMKPTQYGPRCPLCGFDWSKPKDEDGYYPHFDEWDAP